MACNWKYYGMIYIWFIRFSSYETTTFKYIFIIFFFFGGGSWSNDGLQFGDKTTVEFLYCILTISVKYGISKSKLKVD